MAFFVTLFNLAMVAAVGSEFPGYLFIFQLNLSVAPIFLRAGS